jgi:hypothetical protein
MYVKKPKLLIYLIIVINVCKDIASNFKMYLTIAISVCEERYCKQF